MKSIYKLGLLIAFTFCLVNSPAAADKIDDAYKQIKSTYQTLVDAKRPLTWADWDTAFKPWLQLTLLAIRDEALGPSTASTSSTTPGINSVYTFVKNALQTLVDSKRPITWADWDSTFKPTLHQELTSIRLEAVGTASSSSSSGTSSLLMDKKAIKKAVSAKDKGKNKTIPFFGDYLKANIAQGLNSNGLFYLSNYHMSDKDVKVSIEYKGKTYTFNNVEVAYQLGKCLIAGLVKTDADIAKFMAIKSDPDASKILANKTFKYTFNPTFARRIEDLMESLVSQKFINGPLGKKLVEETGKTTLIEGNEWNDTTWGQPFNGIVHAPGENKLGKILMKIRKKIAKKKAKKAGPFKV